MVHHGTFGAGFNFLLTFSFSVLQDQPASVVHYDSCNVLARWYSSLCRYVLEVLRLHGCRSAGIVPGLLCGIHRLDQHGSVTLLLPAHREGYVYQQVRESIAYLYHRLRYSCSFGTYHCWYCALRCMLMHLRRTLCFCSIK